jgi:hypothetical protein
MGEMGRERCKMEWRGKRRDGGNVIAIIIGLYGLTVER